MTKEDYIEKAKAIYLPFANVKPLPQSTRFELGRILSEGKNIGLVANDIAAPLVINRRTVSDMLKYYEKCLSEGKPAPEETKIREAPKTTKPAPGNKSIKLQSDKLTSGKKYKLTGYISEENYKAIRHLAIDIDKDLSELMNIGIELILKKYK